MALRKSLRLDLVHQAKEELKATGHNWSKWTAAKSVFQDAKLDPKTLTESKLKEYWDRKPICTSIAIMFWQRYLWKLALLTCQAANGMPQGGAGSATVPGPGETSET